MIHKGGVIGSRWLLGGDARADRLGLKKTQEKGRTRWKRWSRGCIRPRQVRYQAALRPDSCSAYMQIAEFRLPIDCVNSALNLQSAFCNLPRAPYLDCLSRESERYGTPQSPDGSRPALRRNPTATARLYRCRRVFSNRTRLLQPVERRRPEFFESHRIGIDLIAVERAEIAHDGVEVARVHAARLELPA